jgi:2'-5' RNA ligase
MDRSNGRGLLINSFALVSYLSGPLAALLDEIRHDFAPGSRAKAHLTILPPRSLFSFGNPTAIPEALGQLRTSLQDFSPFTVELGDIEVFSGTNVIYVSIQSGFAELERMHRSLNVGCLMFEEPHTYHPHVTVVQELEPADVLNAAQFARWRWSECKHSRAVHVDRLTFVQNTLENTWTDLASLELGRPVTHHG